MLELLLHQTILFLHYLFIFKWLWNYAQLCICLSSSISFYSFWFVVSSSLVSFVFLIASQIWFVNNFEVFGYIIYCFFYVVLCLSWSMVMSINSPNMKRTPPMCLLNIIDVQQRMITYVLKSTYWVDSNPMMFVGGHEFQFTQLWSH